VIPTWSVNNAATSISIFGLLSAGNVSSNTDVIVSASATVNGVTRTANRTVTINNIPDTTGPGLNVTSPGNNSIVNNSSITVTGVASDSGFGNNGISSVTVNGTNANGGSAIGANTAIGVPRSH